MSQTQQPNKATKRCSDRLFGVNALAEGVIDLASRQVLLRVALGHLGKNLSP